MEYFAFTFINQKQYQNCKIIWAGQSQFFFLSGHLQATCYFENQMKKNSKNMSFFGHIINCSYPNIFKQKSVFPLVQTHLLFFNSSYMYNWRKKTEL